MKHCLKQREKIEKKFTFVTKGNDGPWKNDEVTIKFHKETKNMLINHQLVIYLEPYNAATRLLRRLVYYSAL